MILTEVTSRAPAPDISPEFETLCKRIKHECSNFMKQGQPLYRMQHHGDHEDFGKKTIRTDRKMLSSVRGSNALFNWILEIYKKAPPAIRSKLGFTHTSHEYAEEYYSKHSAGGLNSLYFVFPINTTVYYDFGTNDTISHTETELEFRFLQILRRFVSGGSVTKAQEEDIASLLKLHVDNRTSVADLDDFVDEPTKQIILTILDQLKREFASKFFASIHIVGNSAAINWGSAGEIGLEASHFYYVNMQYALEELRDDDKSEKPIDVYYDLFKYIAGLK